MPLIAIRAYRAIFCQRAESRHSDCASPQYVPDLGAKLSIRSLSEDSNIPTIRRLGSPLQIHSIGFFPPGNDLDENAISVYIQNGEMWLNFALDRSRA